MYSRGEKTAHRMPRFGHHVKPSVIVSTASHLEHARTEENQYRGGYIHMREGSPQGGTCGLCV